MEFKHIPVMPDECISGLDIDPNGIYVDATLGGGGHSLLIAQKLNGGRLICIDQDDEALQSAKIKLGAYSQKITFVKNNFKNLYSVLETCDVKKIDGILFDIGVSSHQIDSNTRGFSYMRDMPLDMRMDKEQELTAKDVVNSLTKEEIAKILFEYAEEANGFKIAENIVKERQKKPISTTFELVEIIEKAVPAYKRKAGHPAKKTFQALRIYVNGELEALKEALCKASDSLNQNGRLCVITFHSLEDRIVKEFLNSKSKECICPKEFPVCVCNHKAELKIITKKPVSASCDEIFNNKRSKSAKLRIAQKLI